MRTVFLMCQPAGSSPLIGSIWFLRLPFWNVKITLLPTPPPSSLFSLAKLIPNRTSGNSILLPNLNQTKTNLHKSLWTFWVSHLIFPHLQKLAIWEPGIRRTQPFLFLGPGRMFVALCFETGSWAGSAVLGCREREVGGIWWNCLTCTEINTHVNLKGLWL